MRRRRQLHSDFFYLALMKQTANQIFSVENSQSIFSHFQGKKPTNSHRNYSKNLIIAAIVTKNFNSSSG